MHMNLGRLQMAFVTTVYVAMLIVGLTSKDVTVKEFSDFVFGAWCTMMVIYFLSKFIKRSNN
ncbi:hypothetical protein CMT48_17150 [Elizabethkingia anophelis]|nr:hypothetical protein [Elizabethkingia anophelis]